jgi:transposase
MARRFYLGRATVYLWLGQRRDEGCLGQKSLGCRSRLRIRDAAQAVLCRLVAADNH